jgi:ribonuclease HII
VVAAVAFEHRKLARLPDVADSKALTAAARERAYEQVTAAALAWHAVIIGSTEIDEAGLHVSNIAGMRRALAGLACQPAYVLTDGFAVRGLGVPALAMWKGDEVAACVAAASVIAKVTRDRLMCELHLRYPEYGFARHKGYSTRSHMKALNAHGPCPEHRRSFVNVSGVVCAAPGQEARAAVSAGTGEAGLTGAEMAADLAGGPLAQLADAGQDSYADPDLVACGDPGQES